MRVYAGRTVSEDGRYGLRARRRAHIEDETAYTLALWRVKEGREGEFVEAR
jgi:hypothetical protein